LEYQTGDERESGSARDAMKIYLAIIAIALGAFETTAQTTVPVWPQVVINPSLPLDCVQVTAESANVTLFYRERPTTRPAGGPLYC
jgi:hypothetical protein